MQVSKIALVAALALSSAACSSLSGYPTDPQPDDALKGLRNLYFSPSADACYKAYTDQKPVPDNTPHDCFGVTGKQAIRDDIVLNRMHVYDMEFTLFVRDLSGGSNAVSLGSDFTALALNGLGATTGDVATKAALAAASGNVIAASGAINKDLFYQKTVPAIIAQMEADRKKAETAIYQGLQETDVGYPLQRATLDLDVLNRAGSINGAVASITDHSTTDKGLSQDQIDAFRVGTMSTSATTLKIQAWLRADKNNITKLSGWSTPPNIPQKYLAKMPFPEMLIDDPSSDMEALRVKAIADPSLGIK